MSTDKPDTGPPFGTIYFGGIVAAFGLLLTVTTTDALGPVLAIAGTMLACTGLVLRGMYRLSRATRGADRVRTPAAPRL